MQNALAILPFPPAQVQPTLPDAAPATQDFALSFAAEMPNLTGDAPAVDPSEAIADQSVTWVIPILPAPGIMPVGLQIATNVDTAEDVQSVPPGTGMPDAWPSLATAPTIESGTDPVATKEPSNAVEFAIAWSADAVEMGRVDDGPVALDFPSKDTDPLPEPPTRVESAGLLSLDGAGVEAPVPQVQSGLATRHPSTTVVAPEQQDQQTTMVAGQTDRQPAIVAAVPLVSDPSPPETSTVTPKPAARLAAEPVAPAPVGAQQPTILPAITESAAAGALSDRLTGEETAPAPGAQVSKPTSLPATAADVVTALPIAPTLQPEEPVLEPKTPTSFWERYFTNGSRPFPEPDPMPNQSRLETAAQDPNAFGLLPMRLAGQDPSEDVGHRSDSNSEPSSTEGDREDLASVATWSASPAPKPAPAVRLETAAVLSVLPWNEGSSDPLEHGDMGLSSLPLLSPVSTHAASGPIGPLSLPVQQVALQLTGVLVQASDGFTELALAPEELGKVRLRMEHDAANPDRLTITINVERPETLDLFRRHAGELAEAIRNAGYSGAQIDFGNQGHGSGREQQHARPGVSLDSATDEIAPPQYSPRMMAGATLDLRL